VSRTADFEDSTWTDPWMQALPPVLKLLFIYLWTNSHRELSGIYSITLKTMADETGIVEKALPEALAQLHPKVLYDRAQALVFVVNFVRHQFMRGECISPAVRFGIRRAIRTKIPRGHPFIKAFCEAYPGVMAIEDYPFGEVSEFAVPEETTKEEAVRRRAGKPKDYQENERYLQFWATYPRKDTGPKAPYKHWPHPMPDDLFSQIMAKVAEFTRSEQWQKPGSVPMATTWLNQQRWKAVVIPAPMNGSLLPAPPGKYADVGARVETDG